MLADLRRDQSTESVLGYLPGDLDAMPRYLFCNGFCVNTRLEQEASGKNNTLSFQRDPITNTLNLHIADQAVLGDPIYILHLINARHPSGMGQILHTIHLGKNSQASLIEMFVLQDKIPVRSCTTLTLDKDARLQHCLLQRAYSEGSLHAETHVHQKTNSTYRGTSLLCGGALNQCRINLYLEEPQAEATLYGLAIAKGSEKLEQIFNIHHQSTQGRTSVKTRGVAYDRSRLSFHGTIHVATDATQNHAALENKNLLLSERATIHTQPQLDIYNADVQCTHGATVGHLDEEALFYLRSRGIFEKEAKDLLIVAFLEPMLEGLSQPLADFLRACCHGS